MKINSVKNIKLGSQLPKKLLAIFLSLAVIAGAYYVLSNAGRDARDTIDVVRVKSTDGISAKTLVTGDMLEKYSLLRKEYNNDMFTYDKINEVLNKYSLYYLRSKSFIYKDQLTKEKPLRNEWLYDLEKSNEALTIPYEYMKCGGDILLPGDLIRVRISYDQTSLQQVTAQGLGLGMDNVNSKTDKKMEVIFESIKVKDLLNSNGHSIYEVYKELLKLDAVKRQELLQNRSFIESILAKSLIVEATSDQVNKYAKYSGMKESSLFITLLSRKDNKNIMDEIPNFTKEVQSWTTGKK